MMVFGEKEYEPALEFSEGHDRVALCVVFAFLLGTGECRAGNALQFFRNRSHQALDVGAVMRLLDRTQMKVDRVFVARCLKRLAAELLGVVHVETTHDAPAWPLYVAKFKLGQTPLLGEDRMGDAQARRHGRGMIQRQVHARHDPAVNVNTKGYPGTIDRLPMFVINDDDGQFGVVNLKHSHGPFDVGNTPFIGIEQQAGHPLTLSRRNYIPGNAPFDAQT